MEIFFKNKTGFHYEIVIVNGLKLLHRVEYRAIIKRVVYTPTRRCTMLMDQVHAVVEYNRTGPVSRMLLVIRTGLGIRHTNFGLNNCQSRARFSPSPHSAHVNLRSDLAPYASFNLVRNLTRSYKLKIFLFKSHCIWVGIIRDQSIRGM